MIKTSKPNEQPNAERNPRRVLVVDNDVRTRRSYQELLIHWGYLPILVEGDGKNLLENARAKVKAERCQFALVDMRLIDDFDEDDKSGLELVSKLQPATCIIISGRGNLADARESLEKGAAGFVGKGEGPKTLRAMLDEANRKVFIEDGKINIYPSEAFSYIESTLMCSIPENFHDQLMDIFAYMFPKAQSLRVEIPLIKNQLRSDRNTIQISLIQIKVFEDDLLPVLMSIGQIDKINLELDKYERYIKNMLNVDLELRSKLTWDIGAIVYPSELLREGTFDVRLRYL